MKEDTVMGKQDWGRRKFLLSAMVASGAMALDALPFAAFSQGEKMTVQQLIERILKEIPGAPFPNTVDTIKAGDASQPVKGIVTTMFATVEVIEKTAAAGANFIIAHEPAFYNHADNTKWLEKDPVYQYKTALLKKHGIVVWRFHDYMHAHKPDGVITGVQEALGWGKYTDANKPWLSVIPATTLQSIIDLAKKKLGISHVRYMGQPRQNCSRVAIIPGAAGGTMQINAIASEKPDLLIVGELNEWETSEYIRDHRAAGGKTALLILGHVQSEEPGMEWMVHWLKKLIPGIKVTHIPSGDEFSYD